MSGAIAIFVKTPGLSPVKTRLAHFLGKKMAEVFHLASAAAVREVVQKTCNQENVQGYYAVAEQTGLKHSYWQDFPCVWQGEGGLGERMAHVYHTLLNRHDFVILIGADIPQMVVGELLSACVWLGREEHARMAFGPSVDGGFWLFGGNCEIPQKLWTEVTYSREDTGTQFLHKIQKFGELKQMDLLQDVDDTEDMLQLKQTLQEMPEPLPAQRALLRLLHALPEPSSP